MMDWIVEWFWRLLARLLADSSALRHLVIDRAMRTPYAHIYGPDGSMYMARWWLVKPRAWLPFSVRVHHIRRPDSDRHLHDHPFDFRTVVMDGFYVEQDVCGRTRPVCMGDTYRSRAERFHRISEVGPGGVFTLFVMGRRHNTWGFLVGERKVDWRDYLGAQASLASHRDQSRRAHL